MNGALVLAAGRLNACRVSANRFNKRRHVANSRAKRAVGVRGQLAVIPFLRAESTNPFAPFAADSAGRSRLGRSAPGQEHELGARTTSVGFPNLTMNQIFLEPTVDTFQTLRYGCQSCRLVLLVSGPFSASEKPLDAPPEVALLWRTKGE